MVLLQAVVIAILGGVSAGRGNWVGAIGTWKA